MRFRLKKGVVLFPMCGELFLVPSRAAGFNAPIILSVSPDFASLLDSKEDLSALGLSEETLKRLRRLTAAGLLEEC